MGGPQVILKGGIVSNSTNDSMLEEAWDYINSGDLSSTGLDKVMEANIVNNDMEGLWKNLVQARDLLREE